MMNVMPTCMEILRGRREMLLQESDWTQFNDSPLLESKIDEWKTYRQALRDLPENNPNPEWVDGDETKLPDVDWPVKPE